MKVNRLSFPKNTPVKIPENDTRVYLDMIDGRLHYINADGVPESISQGDGTISSITGLQDALDAPLQPERAAFLVKTKNLFDKSTITPNSWADEDGVISSNSTLFLSDYIEVEPDATYFCRSVSQDMLLWTAYNAAKVVVPAEGMNVPGGETITVPASGVKYYRFTGRNLTLDSYQFELGGVQTSFEHYGYKFDYQINATSLDFTGWKWARWTSFGDSITSQAKWQPYVVGELGLLSTVLGVGGRKISGVDGMCQDAAVNTIGTDCQILTVMGGVNDWAQNVALGAVASTDTNEFYGALNQMATKLVTRLPACRIFWVTPTYSEMDPAPVGWVSAAANTAGLTTHDYAEAVLVVARRNGFPIIDLAAEEGVNPVNVDAYREDDGNHIHPNDAAGQRMAEVVIGRMKSLNPV